MTRQLPAMLLLFWLYLIGLFGWLCYTTWTDSPVSTSEIAICGGVIDHTGRSNNNLSTEMTLGKKVFRNNCAACHAGDMETQLTGPPLLTGIYAWAEYPKADLFAFIRNSQATIAAGHPRAQFIWQKYQPTVMNSFINLTDEEIEAVIEYIIADNPTPQFVNELEGGNSEWP